MSEPAAFGETEIDWDEATLFLKRRLTRKLGRVDELTLEDLTQETCVRLLRAVRREGATNPHALMTTIADRTAVSHIRRITRERPIFEPLTEVTENLPDPKSETTQVPGDIQERVELVVQEIFRSRRSSCLELAVAFFEKRNWSAVASALGISHDAVRARWSRCVALLRKVVAADPEFRLLADWVTE
ncbi:MAG: sigma-70 family RNA polymerase sigma factor [Candidatus Eisenbacteria sp.]|nr:sigma-70 family RNA polymerase sigma factor [Candidatus Eisenbacteria bacterium]